MRLTGGIELFFGALAGGEVLLGSLNFAGRGQSPNQEFLGNGDLGFDWSLYAGGRSVGGGMFEFLPQNGRIDAEFLRDLTGQFVAYDPAGHALDMRQQVIQSLHFSFCATNRELALGALDQVGEITLRMLEGFAIGVFAFAPNEEIGVESRFESQHLDLEFFLNQQT